MKLTASAAIAALVCLVLAFAGTRSNSVRHILLNPNVSASDPSIQIDVVDAGGSRIEYALTPKLDVVRLDVQFELPPGGRLLQHVAPDGGPAMRGTARLGSARLSLPPTLTLAPVSLVAKLTLAGDGIGAASTVKIVRKTLIFTAIDDEAAEPTTMTAGPLTQDLESARPD